MNQSVAAKQIFHWRLRIAFDRSANSLGDHLAPTLQYSSGFPIQAYDFIKFALKRELVSALRACFDILNASDATRGEELLANIGQGRTGHGSTTEVDNYRQWIERMRDQTESGPRLCWVDIEALFHAAWAELNFSEDILQLSDDDAGHNYQVALSTVVFEIMMNHRFFQVLSLSRVNTTWHDTGVAESLAIWNGLLPGREQLVEQLV